MNILLVDDNNNITSMLAKYIEFKGHQCVIANDGMNGFNMIKNGNFDVVLLDLAMPNFSGKNVLESLSQEENVNNQKIIIFTASSILSDEKTRLIQMGAHSFLNKPIDPDDLINYLEKLDVQ